MTEQIHSTARFIIQRMATLAVPSPIYVHNYTAIYECHNAADALAHAAEDAEAVATIAKSETKLRDFVQFNWSLTDQGQIFDWDPASRAVMDILAAALEAEEDSPDNGGGEFLATILSVAARDQ